MNRQSGEESSQSIDYGAYVRFTGTVNEPDEHIFLDEEAVRTMPQAETKHIVAFDDRRRIRRIVFDPDQLAIVP